MNAITIFPSIIKLELFSSLPSCNSPPKLPNEKLLIFNHIAIRIYIFSVSVQPEPSGQNLTN